MRRMRHPAPVDLPEGGTPADLDMAFRKVVPTVPKAAILEQEAVQKRAREATRDPRRPPGMGDRISPHSPKLPRGARRPSFAPRGSTSLKKP